MGVQKVNGVNSPFDCNRFATARQRQSDAGPLCLAGDVGSERKAELSCGAVDQGDELQQDVQADEDIEIRRYVGQFRDQQHRPREHRPGGTGRAGDGQTRLIDVDLDRSAGRLGAGAAKWWKALLLNDPRSHSRQVATRVQQRPRSDKRRYGLAGRLQRSHRSGGQANNDLQRRTIGAERKDELGHACYTARVR